MRVYLVRHGDAKSKEEDPKRPLSKEGKEIVRKSASQVAEKEVELDGIFHSGKLRAQQTAEIFAKSLASEKEVQETDGLAPTDDNSVWGNRLLEKEKDVMLVGHLPYMEDMVEYLTNGAKSINFNTAVVVCLEREGGKWKFLWKVDPHSL